MRRLHLGNGYRGDATLGRIIVAGVDFPCLTSLVLSFHGSLVVSSIVLESLPNLRYAELACGQSPERSARNSLAVRNCPHLWALYIRNFSISLLEMTELVSLQKLTLTRNHFGPSQATATNQQREAVRADSVLISGLSGLVEVTIVIADHNGTSEDVAFEFARNLSTRFREQSAGSHTVIVSGAYTERIPN